ncbi:hypothetical protein Cni_G28379 [Canna indica]|uniref:Electron transporter n=1 Tax=Canna indica TaxID=4628 RepID=A0AAQ3L9J2_9LILI|nr:hypothetical protein Cni_G28379 [Canna indica]
MEFEAKNVIQIHRKTRHKRSKSDSDERSREGDCTPKLIHHANPVMENSTCNSETKNKPLPEANVQSSLKHEILLLEKRLQDQLTMRCALEKALGFNSSAVCSSNDTSMPKPANELIREISILELEVMHLEQYLLSLYRKAFDQQTSPPSSEQRSTTSQHSQSEPLHESTKLKTPPKRGNSRAQSAGEDCRPKCQEKLLGPGVYRSQSSLSCRAINSSRISPSEESLTRALHSFHYCQPFSFLEEEQNADDSGFISLAEYLEVASTDHVAETPNKLSEDMVRCMAAVYCRLADPPLVCHGLSPSPASSFSSMSALSPQFLGDTWSPRCKRESTLDSRLINPFRVEGLKEFSGPYNAMVEIPLVSRDRRRLRDVDDLLHNNYKLILQQLEKVDPKKLKNDEKLAFWINIYNAIVMHAYVEYGIPEGNVKRTSLLIKAMCNIGGRSINAVMIQGYILRCRSQCTGQWLKTLFKPRMKQKGGDQWQAYAIEQPEPLLHFALCSGNHSDPAVRVYTSGRLFQQLESAKEEYIRATVGIWKEQKILLPKVIDSYAKDTKLTPQRLVDMVQHYLPETLRMAMQKCQHSRSKKIIEWIPHNSSFRYLLSRDLAFPHIN